MKNEWMCINFIECVNIFILLFRSNSLELLKACLWLKLTFLYIIACAVFIHFIYFPRNIINAEWNLIYLIWNKFCLYMQYRFCFVNILEKCLAYGIPHSSLKEFGECSLIIKNKKKLLHNFFTIIFILKKIPWHSKLFSFLSSFLRNYYLSGMCKS